jgi:hypothetical protein
MGRPETEFYNNPFCKVIKMIDMYNDEQLMKAAAMQGQEYKSEYFGAENNVKEIKSLKEIEGWC